MAITVALDEVPIKKREGNRSGATFSLPKFFLSDPNLRQAFCWTQSTKPAVEKFGQAQPLERNVAKGREFAEGKRSNFAPPQVDCVPTVKHWRWQGI